MDRFLDFADLIDRMAASMPERAALRVCDGVGELRDVSWRELRERVVARSGELAAAGSACEAILADGSAECVVEVFAAVRAGLQVALVDPLVPNDMLAPLLASVDADCVWSAQASRQAELESRLMPVAPPAYGAHAVLFFTSGTTSRSKAVVLTDESLMSSAFNGSSLMPLSPDDTLLCLLPLSHVFGFVCGLLWGLACGATVALGRGMRYYAADMAAFDPTAVAVVPRLLEFLVACGALGESLRLVLVGAADCRDELLAAVRARGIRVSLGYGLTETSSGIALSVGGDFHAMTVCPEDEVTISEDGEILVHAPTCLMKGYYRDEARTADAIRDGILHTGDKGYLDAAGLLHVQGRLKDVIALPNGTKVYVPEYEAAVREALGEQDIAVVLQGGALTLACGRLAHAHSDEAVSEAVARALRAYPPASRIGRIVRLGHPLPRTAAGDVERWKIQEELENGNC
ncbi:MAG: long-chain fatty acid--CoA ligase [Coriobacteriaceae bacterium]|nr:long-chain fatty acid--CoA ligase [Coriobacteriaceae bacterium]